MKATRRERFSNWMVVKLRERHLLQRKPACSRERVSPIFAPTAAGASRAWRRQ